MSNNELEFQERIARDECHDAQLLGTDTEGAAHFWSMYHQTVVVVEADNSVETYHIDETPYSGLSEWADHVAAKRGWRGSPNIVDGMSDAIDRAIVYR